MQDGSEAAYDAPLEACGAFVKARREELGMSQGDIIKALGYKSRNAASNVEVGIEGLPAKRIYAWADVLEVPRDAFFRFATGETSAMDAGANGIAGERGHTLTTAERDLVDLYRRLPPKYQRRLRARGGPRLSKSWLAQ